MASSKTQELKEDYLEVDPPIPGQNYVCLSFVSPEDMIRKKALYDTRKYFQHVLDKVKGGQVSLEDSLAQCSMEGFLDYCVAHEEENSKSFNEENEFRTSLRGLKVRGVYESMKEAQRRAKVLQTRDPTFHVFVGQVGYWLPWDPNPDNIENQEYTEQTLNEIVKKYKENKQAKDLVWEQETRKRIELAKAQGGSASVTTLTNQANEVKQEAEQSAQDPTKAIFEGEDVFLARKHESN
jgi:hypothetical protein